MAGHTAVWLALMDLATKIRLMPTFMAQSKEPPKTSPQSPKPPIPYAYHMHIPSYIVEWYYKEE